MTPDTPTLEKKLREVAEYIGLPTHQGRFSNTVLWMDHDGARSVEYNSSWDWLNPVWSKVRKELETGIGNIIGYAIYSKFTSQYHSAVDTDSVADAFEVCYEAIQLLKELKANNK